MYYVALIDRCKNLIVPFSKKKSYKETLATRKKGSKKLTIQQSKAFDISTSVSYLRMCIPHVILEQTLRER